MKISKLFYLFSVICIFLVFHEKAFGHEGHQQEKITVSEKQVE